MKVNFDELDLSIFDRIDDPAFRVEARKEFLYFCIIYLSHYFNLTMADFHPELIKNLTDEEVEMLLIIGFRGSAKSVFASLAFPMWCALEQKFNFVIVINDTGSQLKLNMNNIKYELENNEMILSDYGTMFDPNANWSDTSLLLTNDVLILGRSRGQKVRGLRHRQYRPQLIIIDDAEDSEWVKVKENRDKTEQWFNSEVVPAQQETKCKLIVIGNLLHKNALMYRLKAKKKLNGQPLFTLQEFALIDEDGHVTWKAKYPTEESIQKQKEKISLSAWASQYLLKIIAEEDQIIKETDIHKYPNIILTKIDDFGRPVIRIDDSGVGNDLAISEAKSADYTAMVGGYKVLVNEQNKILVLPNPINKRMDFTTTIKEAKFLIKSSPLGTRFFTEDVGYQRAAIETMEREGISVVAMKPVNDKRARLESIAPHIKSGYVMFAETGCEKLIEQLLGFGTEEHDDMVDALVYLIMGLINTSRSMMVGKVDQL